MQCMTLAAALLLGGGPTTDTWPGFRGDGSGRTEARGLPLEWSPKKNVAWKAELPGYGQSSPAVWKGRVFVTAVEGPDKEKCHVAAFDATTGKRLWHREFAATQKLRSSSFVSRGAPTPVVGADGLYAFFESGDLVKFTHDGEELWRRSLAKDFGEFKANHGLAASPALTSKTVLVLVDHGGPSYLLAVDRKTGKDLWKADRKPRASWSSPVVTTAGGKELIIVSSNGSVQAYDGASGKSLWELDGLSGNTIPSATALDGLIAVGASEGKGTTDVAATSRSNSLLQLTEENGKPGYKVLWGAKKAVASMATPLIHAGHVYFVNRTGVVFCLDAKTGKEAYTARLEGSCWASPLAAGDRVYFFGRDGLTTVLKAGAKEERLAVNKLWEGEGGGKEGGFGVVDPTVYGVAAVDGALYFRTGTELYCVRTAKE